LLKFLVQVSETFSGKNVGPVTRFLSSDKGLFSVTSLFSGQTFVQRLDVSSDTIQWMISSSDKGLLGHKVIYWAAIRAKITCFIQWCNTFRRPLVACSILGEKEALLV